MRKNFICLRDKERKRSKNLTEIFFVSSVKGFYQTTMPCSICKNDLPSNNYAVEEGVFLCLPCFLERHRSRDLTQIPCQSCGALPSMTHRIIS